MKALTVGLIASFYLVFNVQEQPVVISSQKEYQAVIKQYPEQILQEIVKEIPTIKLDIKYATKDNFSGIAVYHQAKAYARKPVIDALRKIQKELNQQGLGLKIFDAYRPYAVTVKFWKLTPIDKKDYVANPNKGSRHNRGCAVDLTIINLKTGVELKMPTPYDSFTKEAAADYENIPPEEKKNRDFLINMMKQNGFNVIKSEWWHFDFKGWENYPLMDIPFQKL
ncbi:M15 family metallopeptidase [Pedobacter cryophilus]|uniref:D-alanyl-D-alanine dipeptidase n=1 Tax=Pedobacter cryophilus TaxID=2571271 RepID=A0A4U1C5E2_9SPHI|nr:M15 family metallopeptidase [Pedobacter cryophilus]TKC00643.1 D-alanyl-D-alanine dipeptidase [Pedobacter cryophilus]